MYYLLFFFFILLATGILIAGFRIRSGLTIILSAILFMTLGWFIQTNEPITFSQITSYTITDVDATTQLVTPVYLEIDNELLYVKLLNYLMLFGGTALFMFALYTFRLELLKGGMKE